MDDGDDVRSVQAATDHRIDLNRTENGGNATVTENRRDLNLEDNSENASVIRDSGETFSAATARSSPVAPATDPSSMVHSFIMHGDSSPNGSIFGGRTRSIMIVRTCP